MSSCATASVVFLWQMTKSKVYGIHSFPPISVGAVNNSTYRISSLSYDYRLFYAFDLIVSVFSILVAFSKTDYYLWKCLISTDAKSPFNQLFWFSGWRFSLFQYRNDSQVPFLLVSLWKRQLSMWQLISNPFYTDGQREREKEKKERKRCIVRHTILGVTTK